MLSVEYINMYPAWKMGYENFMYRCFFTNEKMCNQWHKTVRRQTKWFVSKLTFRCRSYLGKQGDKQTLTLGSGCGSIATVLHELMHAIGFLHEQSRPDRNYYVNVLYENILPGKQNIHIPLTLYLCENIGRLMWKLLYIYIYI